MNGATRDWQFGVAVSWLGYECHHQQNLKTMGGAKSNALLFRGANYHPGCPGVAPVSKLLYIVLRDERKR
jgi:hypothetical protein